jgi:hypothetical protein
METNSTLIKVNSESYVMQKGNKFLKLLKVWLLYLVINWFTGVVWNVMVV